VSLGSKQSVPDIEGSVRRQAMKKLGRIVIVLSIIGQMHSKRFRILVDESDAFKNVLLYLGVP
jgi:hypothetical protein